MHGHNRARLRAALNIVKVAKQKLTMMHAIEEGEIDLCADRTAVLRKEVIACHLVEMKDFFCLNRTAALKLKLRIDRDRLAGRQGESIARQGADLEIQVWLS